MGDIHRAVGNIPSECSSKLDQLCEGCLHDLQVGAAQRVVRLATILRDVGVTTKVEDMIFGRATISAAGVKAACDKLVLVLEERERRAQVERDKVAAVNQAAKEALGHTPPPDSRAN